MYHLGYNCIIVLLYVLEISIRSYDFIIVLLYVFEILIHCLKWKTPICITRSHREIINVFVVFTV